MLNFDVDKQREETILMAALRKNNLQAAELLVTLGCDVDSPNINGLTALHQAAINSNIEGMEWLLDHGAAINLVDNDGFNVFHEIACVGGVESLQLIVDTMDLATESYLLNAESYDGETPFMSTCYNNNIEVAEYLLELGVDMNYMNYNGETPLSWAILKKHPRIVELLLENGADVTVVNYSNETLLHRAVYHGDFEILRMILRYMRDAGFNALHTVDTVGDTPFLYACYYGMTDAATILLNLGADINHKNLYGQTALFHAITQLKPETVEWLLDNGADMFSLERDHESILHVATKVGDVKIFKIALDAILNFDKSKVDCQNERGITPLITAGFLNNFIAAEKLIQAGADINLKLACGISAVHYSCLNGQPDVFKLLVEKGADMSQTVQGGFTLLHYLAIGGNVDNLQLAISSKDFFSFDINHQNDHGTTPFIIACDTNNLKMAEEFLKLGAKIDHKDKNGTTALNSSAGYGKFESFKWLLEKGADFNQISEQGLTIMHHLAFGGNVQSLQFLNNFLPEGGTSFLNAQNDLGQTPLMVAYQRNNFEFGLELIKLGAELDLKDKNEKTIIDLIGNNPRLQLLLDQ